MRSPSSPAARNTLVVVEHDEETIRRADHVSTSVPSAGVRGGELVAAGTVADLERNPRSITGRFLREPLLHPAQPQRPVQPGTARLTLARVALHNLRGGDVHIPLGRLVVITGVSGSGKSTVARDVLYANLKRLLGEQAPGRPAARRRAAHRLRRAHRARAPRARAGSRPDPDRQDAALLPGHLHRLLGRDPPHLRRHHRGAHPRLHHQPLLLQHRAAAAARRARARACKTIEMSFLPDVKVLCDVCGGRRFNAETLSVTWRDKSIGDVLAMNVDDAVDFFAAHPRVHHALQAAAGRRPRLPDARPAESRRSRAARRSASSW